MVHHDKIVAILRGITCDEIIEHTACLLHNGISHVEIPTNSPHWQESVQRARAHFGRELHLGVGTVLTMLQVKESADLGADFILAPNLNISVAEEARNLKLSLIAGVFSPTEIFLAAAWGISQVKLFPASALPLDYPAMLKGPLSSPLRFMAVGGVNVTNTASYLQHYDSVGIGSSLYQPGQSVRVTGQKCQALENRLR